jgi:hypothetical protein
MVMGSWIRVALFAAALSCAVACGHEPDPVGGTDAAPAGDAGANAPDAGPMDAAPPPDANPCPDAGAIDAGAFDAALGPDAAPIDAGPCDRIDAGPTRS